MEFIVQNETVGSSKNLYEKKITKLKERLKNREEGKESKDIINEVQKVTKGRSTGHDTEE